MPAATHEMLEQLNELGGVQPFGVDLEPEFAQRIDRRDRAYALPLSAGGHFRGLATQPPSAPQNLIRTYPRFVEKENLRPAAFGSRPQLRKLPPLPMLDRHRVALVGSPQRLLRRDVKFSQQPSHRRHTQLHSEPLRDQRRDDLPRPQPEVKAVLPGILAVNPMPHLQLLRRRELRLWPGVLARPQRLLAAALHRPQPAVDGGTTESTALHHAARALTGLDPTHRPAPYHFRGVVRQRSAINLQRLHATKYTLENLQCVA